jgi:hypothetical protein
LLHKRPLLIVGGARYELKASDKADASVAEKLARFSKGDTGTYVVKGTRGTVNGVDGHPHRQHHAGQSGPRHRARELDGNGSRGARFSLQDGKIYQRRRRRPASEDHS